MHRRSWTAAAFLLLSTVLSACGGGDSRPSDPEARLGDAPSGLMVGYYLEDAATNPEDPMPGAFVINVPPGEASFEGQMYFTYVGCQSENVGVIGGRKTPRGELAGSWGGDVDGHAVGGSYQGLYNRETGLYAGTYVNAGGKLDIEIPDCIQYYVAPQGTFRIFPVEVTWPSSFGLHHDGAGQVSWRNPPDADSTFVTVIDRQEATTGGLRGVLQQAQLPVLDTTDQFDASAYLGRGRDHVVVVVSLSATGELLAYSSLIVR